MAVGGKCKARNAVLTLCSRWVTPRGCLALVRGGEWRACWYKVTVQLFALHVHCIAFALSHRQAHSFCFVHFFRADSFSQQAQSFSLTHPLTHSHTHTLSHTHATSLTHTETTHPLSLSHTQATHTHSLSPSHTLPRTHKKHSNLHEVGKPLDGHRSARARHACFGLGLYSSS